MFIEGARADGRAVFFCFQFKSLKAHLFPNTIFTCFGQEHGPRYGAGLFVSRVRRAALLPGSVEPCFVKYEGGPPERGENNYAKDGRGFIGGCNGFGC